MFYYSLIFRFVQGGTEYRGFGGNGSAQEDFKYSGFVTGYIACVNSNIYTTKYRKMVPYFLDKQYFWGVK